ncbi:MAG: YkgJ family cysteine cluster protein, partial [Chloroflexi bacterium]|nr:YkgJ family cysteine cluster protein [Chloroflexota bacterium]
PDGRAATQPIPCFQCGLCCIKWQPLLSPPEIRQMAADLGLSARTFRRRHIRPYPLRRGWGMLTTGATGGCTFLAFEQGRSICTVYAHRPAVCREWGAGLDKSECVTGLRRMGDEGLLTLDTLLDVPAERAELTEAVMKANPRP